MFAVGVWGRGQEVTGRPAGGQGPPNGIGEDSVMALPLFLHPNGLLRFAISPRRL